MMKFGKKGLALLLCAGLGASLLTGCGKKKEEAAATIFTYNGEAVDNKVATFLFRMQEASFDEIYGNMFAQYYGGANVWDMDLTGQGELYGDTFRKDFEATLEKLMVAQDHAKDYDIELTDDEEKAISDAVDKFIADNDAAALEAMEADKDTVVKALEMQTIQKKVENEVAKTADTEVSDEEAAQRKISYICYTPTTESESETEGLSEAGTEAETAAEASSAETEAVTPVASESETAVETEDFAKTKSADTEAAEEAAQAAETEAAADGTEAAKTGAAESATEAESETETESPEMQAARAKYKKMAEDAFSEIQSGEKTFSDLYDELSEKNETGIMASQTTFGSDDTYPSEEIRKATEGLKDDTLVDHIVEANGNYYIIHVDEEFDREATDQKKEEIISERKQTAIDDQYTEWEKDVTFDTDSAAYDQIQFDRTYKAPETTAADTSTEVETAEAVSTEADTTAPAQSTEASTEA